MHPTNGEAGIPRSIHGRQILHGPPVGPALPLLDDARRQVGDLHQTITRHSGEAIKIRERYEALTPVEKQRLRAFLNSL